MRPVAKLCANQIFAKTLQLPPRLPQTTQNPNQATALKASDGNVPVDQQVEPNSEYVAKARQLLTQLPQKRSVNQF
jgi:type VI protein secretion system component VasK